jgi:DNA adenine methylase
MSKKTNSSPSGRSGGALKTPITYYGGKQTLVSKLLPLIPKHSLYCEPYFGGGALFFAKSPSEVEVINDLNGEVVNFFKVVKTDFSALQKEIIATPHSREEFKKAKVIYDHPELFDKIKRAWAFWTLTNQGFAGMIGSWGFGRTNSKEVTLSNKREGFTEVYKKRLDKVQMECNDALKVIDRCDSKDSFFYLDPPYYNSHQGHYKGFSESDFEALLQKAAKLKGKFILSSYPSPLLNKYIKQHKWHVQTAKKSVAVTKLTEKIKTEVMVLNYSPKVELVSKSSEKKVDVLIGG